MDQPTPSPIDPAFEICRLSTELALAQARLLTVETERATWQQIAIAAEAKASLLEREVVRLRRLTG